MAAQRKVSFAAERLKEFPLVAHLTGAEAERFVAHLSPRHYAVGSVVFGAGEKVLGMYLIESGCVQLFRRSPAGHEQVLAILQPGQILADWALFLGDLYPVSALCIAESNLLYVKSSVVINMVKDDHVLALNLLGSISWKLKRALGLIEDLTLRDARGRLCRYLCSFLTGTAADQHVELPASQAVIARMLGITAETLSRTLTQLKADGIISPISRRQLTVVDLEALRVAAGEPEV